MHGNLELTHRHILVLRCIRRQVERCTELLRLVEISAQRHDILPRSTPFLTEKIEAGFFECVLSPYERGRKNIELFPCGIHLRTQRFDFLFVLFAVLGDDLRAQEVMRFLRSRKDMLRFVFSFCIFTKCTADDFICPLIVEFAQMLLPAHDIIVTHNGGRRCVILGQTVKDLGEYPVAAHLCLHLLCFEAEVTDAHRDVVFFEHLVLDARIILAQREEIVTPILADPLLRLWASTAFRVLCIRTTEEIFGRALFCPLDGIHLPRGEHDVHMRVTFAV